MSHEAQTDAPPDKKAARRELRTRRRSSAPQRDRSADADAIAAAATTLLDTLLLPRKDRKKQDTSGQDTSGQDTSGQDIGEHSASDTRPWVAVYRSLPTEPPTEALAAMLHSLRIRVIVPEMLPDRDLEWRELRRDGSEGPRLGLDGIAVAQVIFAPALAVDHTGMRLGQGGGSYDRALPRRRADAVIVAIVNDQEYAAGTLPFDAHDVRMDGVITPGGGFSQIADAGRRVIGGDPGSVA